MQVLRLPVQGSAALLRTGEVVGPDSVRFAARLWRTLMCAVYFLVLSCKFGSLLCSGSIIDDSVNDLELSSFHRMGGMESHILLMVSIDTQVKTLMNPSPALPVFTGKEARQWLLRMRESLFFFLFLDGNGIALLRCLRNLVYCPGSPISAVLVLGVLPSEPVGRLVYRKEPSQPDKEPEPPSLCYEFPFWA
ncbi:hypothetical protein FNV43_RR08355 [Rhamnella rubrinervis]|uniref:Uncharacterized protein n=1 Tax=Rhamnella rubrinervis TaxID=2594499 RepID=A0A8K0MN70_9ROSA|nr:hypothetical protein FNV43_RR08355 [Rhamnella rubrinervis]